MKDFYSILSTRRSKKVHITPFAALVCKQAKENGIKTNEENRDILTKNAIKNLLKINKDKKKRLSTDLLTLWAKLDMEKYIDSFFDLTINPYISDKPVKDLDNYFLVPYKYLNLIDIKLIDKIKINETILKKVYIATYEIKDKKYDAYRPYVELYIKENNDYKLIGTGFDTNDNKFLELNIEDFNYAINLSYKGYITLPYKENKMIHLNVYDILTDSKINDLLSNVFYDDLKIEQKP